LQSIKTELWLAETITQGREEGFKRRKGKAGRAQQEHAVSGGARSDGRGIHRCRAGTR